MCATRNDMVDIACGCDAHTVFYSPGSLTYICFAAGGDGMSGDYAKVQTAHKEKTVCHINSDGHDRKSLRAALESRIDTMDQCSHTRGMMFDEHLTWSNSPTKRQW